MFKEPQLYNVTYVMEPTSGMGLVAISMYSVLGS